jgi:hypothetical protein
MQKFAASLFARLRAILDRRTAASLGQAEATIVRPKRVWQPRPQNISLRLVTDPVAAKSLKAGSLLGASMGTVILAGFSGPALGQSGEEACAFVLQLRSPYTVERVLEQFPNDPCIPVMLTTISPQLLARVSRAKVLALQRPSFGGSRRRCWTSWAADRARDPCRERRTIRRRPTRTTPIPVRSTEQGRSRRHNPMVNTW